MESLSPECTPLKHKYDSCFNAWFEGYLQPALDASSSRAVKLSSTDQSVEMLEPLLDSQTSTPSNAPSPRQTSPTSWAQAIGKSSRQHTTTPLPPPENSDADALRATEDPEQPVPLIDWARLQGMPRTARKAAEYDLACGQLWRRYRECLTKAIGRNQSLTTLLEQARGEHPLKDQQHLEGTPWDPAYKPAE